MESSNSSNSSSSSSSSCKDPRTRWTFFDRLFRDAESLPDLCEEMLGTVEQVNGSGTLLMPYKVSLNLRQVVQLARLRPQNYTVLLRTLMLTMVLVEECVRRAVVEEFREVSIVHGGSKPPLGDVYGVEFVELFLLAVQKQMTSLLDSNFEECNCASYMRKTVLELGQWWNTKDIQQIRANSVLNNEVSSRSTGCNFTNEPPLPSAAGAEAGAEADSADDGDQDPAAAYFERGGGTSARRRAAAAAAAAKREAAAADRDGGSEQQQEEKQDTQTPTPAPQQQQQLSKLERLRRAREIESILLDKALED